MPNSNVELIKGAYAAFAKGDVPTVVASMDPKIVWNEAENFPYADKNPYVGPTAIVEGVFARLGSEWENFGVKVEGVLDAGDRVVTFGRYAGAYKGTGKPLTSQFCHIWTVAGGKVTGFQQYVDTLGVAKAMKA